MDLEQKVDALNAEVQRIDKVQRDILSQLGQQGTTLTELSNMVKPISDYFAFGRVSKRIFVALASLAAVIAAIVTTWDTFIKWLSRHA